ncbi:MAG: hypothetical protein EOO07_07410 [Chitinophagaceae bacterium]|nr:MAG: hypothetical protein EOO07_07410 [Chitinophagaceae bacterium]
MIYVYRTSVCCKKAVLQLSPYINNILQRMAWNFDLEDCDKILRLNTNFERALKVVMLLRDKGFECSELED